MKKTAITAALMLASAAVCAQPVYDKGNGRYDFGWGGAGGGNLEVYSETASGAYDGRDGQFKFIFGGRDFDDLGYITFTHASLSNGWVDVARIYPDGTFETKGELKATSVLVEAWSGWPDYVFRDDYSLMSIEDLNRHITEKGHLPGIPSAEEVSEQGIDLGLVSTKTLEKVEELALYVIQLKKENDTLRAELGEIRDRLDRNP